MNHRKCGDISARRGHWLISEIPTKQIAYLRVAGGTDIRNNVAMGIISFRIINE